MDEPTEKPERDIFQNDFFRINVGHVLIAVGLFGSAMYSSAQLVATVSTYGVRLDYVQTRQSAHDETLAQINDKLTGIQQDIAGIQGTLKQSYQPGGN